MKLLARFNLIFITIFGVGTVLAVWFAYGFLRQNAKTEVLEQARLMMETTLATRSYTTEQIQPLLNKVQAHDTEFLPQTVPAYSATQVFDYLHKRNPEYTYKEATLNPTNLIDRASDWEADIVNNFRNNATLTEYKGERDTPTGRSFYYARPLHVVSPACLECHSTPANAPRSLIKQYGSNNGFGWKLNEVIGAQIVSVPESLPIRIADNALKTLILYFVLVAVIVLVVLDAVLIATVIRPVARLSKVADEISQGKLEVEDLPAQGKDEISTLAASFNRMQRSLVRAMKMLESDDENSGNP
jgi:HAMP domain-containing protein